MKKIKIYRTGWELYQGRGVWDTYYTDWTTDKNVADKQFLELTEFYKDYPAGLHRVIKVESSTLSIEPMTEAFIELDNYPKNSFPFCQYDMDTCQGTPNFPKGRYVVNVGKEEYLGYIYDKFVKVPEDGYYAYEFALVNNGKVIAIGNEQGRCGGVTYSCRDKDFEDRLKKSLVYDKVKHLPIATEDELEEPTYRHFNSYMEYEKYMRKNTKKVI